MRLLFATAILALALPAFAQHNHGAGHDVYQGWASQKVANCCNNQDCGALNDDEVRETTTGTEVRIDDQWCPVLHQHHLIKGKSPDWNTPHACVRRYGEGCDRLLCYTGKGGF
jgi:hypothetical protein